MNGTSTLDPSHQASSSEASSYHNLEHLIEHAAHLLPAQGPITVFVHHNTLHAFEQLPFDEALKSASAAYDCHPFLPEAFYQSEVARGRIGRDDLEAVLIDDLGEDADFLIGFMGTRYHLRLAMLEHPLRLGTDDELRWLITGTDVLQKFRPEAPADARARSIDQTRRAALRECRENRSASSNIREHDVVLRLIDEFGTSRLEHGSDRVWESFTLRLLWRVCHAGVHAVKRFGEPPSQPIRHRDWLLWSTGTDTDLLVHDVLIRFCAAFLDQGLASWPLPGREHGFFRAFVDLYRDSRPVEPWLSGLPEELRRIDGEGHSAIASVAESLQDLGIPASEYEAFLTASLLALPGWTGMLRQMETSAEWAVRPAPTGTLQEYLAIRLILERLALRHVTREEVDAPPALCDVRQELRHRIPHPPRVSVEQRAYLVFQLAQVRGWSPGELNRLSKIEWARLVEEIESFESLARRRVYHLAFERRYRQEALDAVAAHIHRPRDEHLADNPPHFQVITCIDDREESFRRHLEEAAPEAETFGVAGFFGVAMYYQGTSDAHFRPLCPVVVRPRHYVREQAAYSLTTSSRQRAETRRILGSATRRWHESTRGLLSGGVTAMLGSLASIPLLSRVLFPRLTARIARQIGGFVEPPRTTELQIQRVVDPPGPNDDHLGFSDTEMADVVERMLRDIGLTHGFSRLILIVGHGSSSLNNPHESAYNCGACSGGLGGANARAFAQMANDPRVRSILAERGFILPEETVFVGAFHNTCSEDVLYYDLDRIPFSHRRPFERVRNVIDHARERNAHERCRRFESADLGLSFQAALTHVETRAEDLSQVRPEYNHATNALCLVGRRGWSRNLFLDRRAFLTSYDPTLDDEEHTILARILQAVVPVCAGINLEYFFSRVDVVGYGCGSKLPHNITSLLGVMEGALSDLRAGLSQQMVEIHEPLRLLMLIETTPEVLESIMNRVAAIGQLVRNEWVQLATIEPESRSIHIYRQGAFQRHSPDSSELPIVSSSLDWYRSRRENLGFASIDPRAGIDLP